MADVRRMMLIIETELNPLTIRPTAKPASCPARAQPVPRPRGQGLIYECGRAAAPSAGRVGMLGHGDWSLDRQDLIAASAASSFAKTSVVRDGPRENEPGALGCMS